MKGVSHIGEYSMNGSLFKSLELGNYVYKNLQWNKKHVTEYIYLDHNLMNKNF